MSRHSRKFRRTPLILVCMSLIQVVASLADIVTLLDWVLRSGLLA
jgi:hypothetical protein